MRNKKQELTGEQKSDLKTIGNFILIIIFWCCLIVECIALYTKHYDLRFYSRTFMVPLLILRIFNKEKIFSVQVFIYLSLLFSWFGDILNLIVDYKLQYLASSFYTVSYIIFGIVFYNFRDKKKLFFNYLFYTVFAILGVIVFFIFKFPALADKLLDVHLFIHGIVLVYALIWAFAIRKEMRMHSLKYFISATFSLILANGIYAIDYYKINTGIHYFTYRHTSVDCMVAICYAAGIYLFSQGIYTLKYLKPEKNDIE